MPGQETIGRKGLNELANQLERGGVTSELLQENLLSRPDLMTRLAHLITQGSEAEIFDTCKIVIDEVAHRHHSNGNGLVAETAHVDPTAYVGPWAVVQDTAQVLDTASIDGRSIISGSSVLRDNVVVSQDVEIRGSAELSENVTVRGRSVITTARLSGNVRIRDAKIDDAATLLGNCSIHGVWEEVGLQNFILHRPLISGHALVEGFCPKETLEISGNVAVLGEIRGHGIQIHSRGHAIFISSSSKVQDNAQIIADKGPISIGGKSVIGGNTEIKKGKFVNETRIKW